MTQEEHEHDRPTCPWGDSTFTFTVDVCTAVAPPAAYLREVLERLSDEARNLIGRQVGDDAIRHVDSGVEVAELARQADTPAYREYLALLARIDGDPASDADGGPDYGDHAPATCGATFVTGPQHDPYSTGCDQPPRHYPQTPHEAPDPLGEAGRIRWNGGGTAGGDRLPYRDVERFGP